MNYAIKHRKTKRGIEGEIPEVTILGTDRRRTAPILPLPSLSKMMEPQPFEEYAKNYFQSILGVPQLPAPHQLIPGGFLPMYEEGTEGDDTITNIPEVTVTPDPVLRKRVVDTWPNEDVRKEALREISVYKQTAEKENPPAYYNNKHRTSSLRGGRIPTNEDLPANYEVERAMDLADISGHPHIIPRHESNFRSFYVPGVPQIKQDYYRPSALKRLFWKIFLPSKYKEYQQANLGEINIGTDDSRDPYFSEMSHAYQFANKLDSFGQNTPEDYDSANSIEFQAHDIIQPMLYQYLRSKITPAKLKQNITRNIQLVKDNPYIRNSDKYPLKPVVRMDE